MKRILLLGVMALAFLILAACGTKSPSNAETLGKNAAAVEASDSDEIKLNPADLPAVILAYLDQHFQGFVIEEAELEGSGAAATYTVKIQLNGQEMELLFDSAGAFVGLEEDEDSEEHEGDEENEGDEGENEREINISELPQAVGGAIATLYLGAALLEADEITAADGSLSYDIEIQVGSEIMEVMFAADGTFLGIEQNDDEENGLQNNDEDNDDNEDEDGDNDGDHEFEDGE